MTPIPPKGQTVVDIEVNPVSHGCEVVVRLRSLTLGQKVKDDHTRALLYALRAIATELDGRGMNYLAAIAELPQIVEREDLGGAEPPEGAPQP